MTLLQWIPMITQAWNTQILYNSARIRKDITLLPSGIYMYGLPWNNLCSYVIDEIYNVELHAAIKRDSLL